MARLAAQVVGRAQYSRFLIEVGIDLAVAVGVVAEREHVDPGLEQAGGDLAGNAGAAGRVLAVGDHECRFKPLAQRGQESLHRSPPDTPDDVADEKDP